MKSRRKSFWQGRVAYLSRETMKWLKVWLYRAEISEGVEIDADAASIC
jgi:hypothetical protein